MHMIISFFFKNIISQLFSFMYITSIVNFFVKLRSTNEHVIGMSLNMKNVYMI